MMKLAIILFFVISSILTLGECVFCYSCKNDSISAVQEYKLCDEQFIKDKMNNCSGNYCLKIVATSSNDSYSVQNVRRLCTDSLSNLGHTIITKNRKTRSLHSESATFYYCDSDFCNGSTNLSIFIILLSISFINFIL